MAHTPLALLALPAALLLGGAVPAGTINDMAECKLSYADMRATAAAVPMKETRDESVAPQRKIYNFFGGPMPRLYGFTATGYGSTDMLDQSGERYMIISTIAGATYDEVRDAVLKVHGAESCPMAAEGRCIGGLRNDGDKTVVLLVTQYPNYVSVGCGYGRKKG